MMPATGSTASGEGVGQKISRKANEALDSVKAAMPGSHTTTTGTHTTAGTHTTHTTTGAHGTHGGVAQKAEQAFEKAKAAIPGTAEHGALHPHTAAGGVHHTTGTGHHTTTGAGTGGVAYKTEAALAGVKEKIPGTAEHKATHPTTAHGHVAGGMGTTGMGGMGTGTTHTTTTGTTGTHGGGIGAKVGAAVAGVKEKIPGTAEHKATHPTL